MTREALLDWKCNSSFVVCDSRRFTPRCESIRERYRAFIAPFVKDIPEIRREEKFESNRWNREGQAMGKCYQNSLRATSLLPTRGARGFPSPEYSPLDDSVEFLRYFAVFNALISGKASSSRRSRGDIFFRDVIFLAAYFRRVISARQRRH